MTTTCDNPSSSTPGLAADSQPQQSTVPETWSASNGRVVVVGLYGVPGSGKTFLLNQLKQELRQEHFTFYEGSEMIATVVPGGLDVFQDMREQEKVHWRQLAIDTIRKQCVASERVAVVAGHFMFWPEEEEVGRPVYTQHDLGTYTHILYLDVPAGTVAQRRLDDVERGRPSASVTHLCKWQQAEKTQLRRLCRHHGILFSLLPAHSMPLDNALLLLRDFQYRTEKVNLFLAQRMLDDALRAKLSQLKTVLLFDADRTLAAEDTGALFWRTVSNSRQLMEDESPLKALFSSPLGYSYTAFYQAALLYQEAASDPEFDAFCQDVASAVTMYPELTSLLQLTAEQEHVRAFVVTSGLRPVWEKVLEREGLSNSVKVIGGGRITDGVVVTAAVKANLASRLKIVYKMNVWAFGDSPLDLGMLSEADQAIVVVGAEQTRSRNMDAALLDAIDNNGLRARQAVLPCTGSPGLDTTKLPLIQLTAHEFVDSFLGSRCQHAGIRVVHATERNTAKLLMTPMRDARITGPALRQVHRRVGWYLATEFVADVIGVEEHPIPHVQGHCTGGYRLLHEQQTSIVALMRGGEAMAFGVNDAFPLAMFVHASSPDDIMLHHLQGQLTVVLVDSVVNSGMTVVQFVQHARDLHATIRIIVVAGVVQATCAS